MKWYIIYTNSRAEKKVAERLEKAGYEYYLPLTKKIRKWSDRRKIVEEPLFNSYIFIKTDLHYRYEINQIDGVIKFVSFRKELGVVSEYEINLIKKTLEHDSESIELESIRYEKGEVITINDGPLTGYKGEVVKYKNVDKLLIRLEGIYQSLVVSIPKVNVEKTNNA